MFTLRKKFVPKIGKSIFLPILTLLLHKFGKYYVNIFKFADGVGTVLDF